MPPRSPRILGVGDFRKHPAKHVVAIPEMMLQRRSDMGRHQHHEKHHQDMMNVFRNAHDRPAGRGRELLQRKLRPGDESGETQRSRPGDRGPGGGTMSLHALYQVVAQLWVVWLVLLFAGIVAWAYLPRNRKKMIDNGNIPLRDDSEERSS